MIAVQVAARVIRAFAMAWDAEAGGRTAVADDQRAVPYLHRRDGGRDHDRVLPGRNFHGSLQAQENGTLPLHFTGATLAIVGGNVLALVLGIHWRKSPETRLTGLVSIVVGAFGLASVVALFVTFDAGLPSGAIERGSVYTIVIWQLAVAAALLRGRDNFRAPRVATTGASTGN
jgi:hypothetical protein